MKFLVPVGGIDSDIHGVMTSYKHKGIPKGITSGLLWAGDNCAFTGMDERRFIEWLEAMAAYASTCLFVAAPDVMGDAAATIANFEQWQRRIAFPVAYVAQDGSEKFAIPDGAAALFVGGTTAWKELQAAISVIERGQQRGLHIHIGRVNWQRRYRLFCALGGQRAFYL